MKNISQTNNIYPLPGTERLDVDIDFADQMVAGINHYLKRALKASVGLRARHWHRDYTSHVRYERSIEKNRNRFHQIIGLVDDRKAVELQCVADMSRPDAPGPCLGEGAGYKIYAVRWHVLKSMEGEGLLLIPDGHPGHAGNM